MCFRCVALGFPSGTDFCATFEAASAGAQGGFALRVDEAKGLSSYYFDIDTSKFSTTCDLSKGLKYHIHSYWTSTSSSSSVCGNDVAGAHLDPNFACSSVSQYAVEPLMCDKLSRTASQGYTYNCTVASFQEQGNLNACEVGDLSGKFGLSISQGAGVFRPPKNAVLYDPLGPIQFQYGKVTGWKSVVFHCNDEAKTRLFCAELQPASQNSACEKLFA